MTNKYTNLHEEVSVDNNFNGVVRECVGTTHIEATSI